MLHIEQFLSSKLVLHWQPRWLSQKRRYACVKLAVEHAHFHCKGRLHHYNPTRIASLVPLIAVCPSCAYLPTIRF
eukprot:1152538-Pelagomonas_calceolata.AAC.7